MNITVSQEGGYILAKVQGTVDESAKSGFDAQLHELVERVGATIVIDMSDSARITSAGIGHLVTLVSRANTKGSRVILASPSPYVTSILETTKLNSFFEVVPSIMQAIDTIDN